MPVGGSTGSTSSRTSGVRHRHGITGGIVFRLDCGGIAQAGNPVTQRYFLRVVCQRTASVAVETGDAFAAGALVAVAVT